MVGSGCGGAARRAAFGVDLPRCRDRQGKTSGCDHLGAEAFQTYTSLCVGLQERFAK